MTRHDDLIISDDAGELIASVPGWLTFYPAELLLLVGVAPDTTPPVVHYIQRFPLCNFGSVHVDDLKDLTHEGATSRGVGTVELLVIAAASAGTADLPHRQLVTEFTRMLRDLGITVARSLWVERIKPGQTWRSYTDDLDADEQLDLKQRPGRMAAPRIHRRARRRVRRDAH
jgi:hypothetical protein